MRSRLGVGLVSSSLPHLISFVSSFRWSVLLCQLWGALPGEVMAVPDCASGDGRSEACSVGSPRVFLDRFLNAGWACTPSHSNSRRHREVRTSQSHTSTTNTQHIHEADSVRGACSWQPAPSRPPRSRSHDRLHGSAPRGRKWEDFPQEPGLLSDGLSSSVGAVLGVSVIPSWPGSRPEAAGCCERRSEHQASWNPSSLLWTPARSAPRVLPSGAPFPSPEPRSSCSLPILAFVLWPERSLVSYV